MLTFYLIVFLFFYSWKTVDKCLLEKKLAFTFCGTIRIHELLNEKRVINQSITYNIQMVVDIPNDVYN